MSTKTSSKEEKTTPKKDPLYSLKAKAYYRVFGNPNEDNLNFQDLLVIAKTHLCLHSNRLVKDPIWDEYSDVELLVEYYSLLFMNNKDFRQKFEVDAEITGDAYEDFDAWSNEQIQKADKEREQISEEFDDSVSFSPDDLIGGDNN